MMSFSFSMRPVPIGCGAIVRREPSSPRAGFGARVSARALVRASARVLAQVLARVFDASFGASVGASFWCEFRRECWREVVRVSERVFHASFSPSFWRAPARVRPATHRRVGSRHWRGVPWKKRRGGGRFLPSAAATAWSVRCAPEFFWVGLGFWGFLFFGGQFVMLG